MGDARTGARNGMAERLTGAGEPAPEDRTVAVFAPDGTLVPIQTAR